MATPKIEHRHGSCAPSTLRRQVNDLFMRDGEVEESKLWANVGKGVCVYLLLVYTDDVLKTEYTLVTLLIFVIAPDMVKKLISMRFGIQDKGGK